MPCKKLLLRTFYRDFYEPLALRSRRVNTKRLYQNTLNSFERFLCRAPRLSDLTDATVSRFASYRRRYRERGHCRYFCC